ncbi:mechanosensitive ion channel family protein [Micromonospora radicis]|uniref:Uncharacterized protein n=1 Tax=Micromonospora radicis TaxID=1894971 RepID=A0A418N233_9ACTN|nr:hypothetical protein [Micromonospora radicis]RIV41662.1 hypothetical protein D2L64_02465 [Micromonospora radicis]
MRDNFGDAVGDTLRSILLFLPKAVAFVAILVAGWLVAKAVLKIVDRLLDRVGFDRAVERGGIRRALARSRYDASDIVARLAYYGVLLLTLYLAFGIWGPNPISDLIAGIIAWLPRAFVAIVIVVVAAAIATAVKDIISGALGGLSYGRLLATIASAFILGLGIIAALNQIGVATAVTTPVLIAVLATAGGILVVGVGGGLIRPMQSRWESWLSRAEQESRTIAEHARAYSAGRREAEARRAEPAATPTPAPVPTFSVPAPAGPSFGTPTTAGPVADFPAPTAGPAVHDDPEATQVVNVPAADSDPTTPLPRPDDPDATQVTSTTPGVPAQRSADDADSTIVLPRNDDDSLGR